MAGAYLRRADNEVSLPLAVTNRLRTKRIPRGGEGRGYQERAVKGGGEGTSHLLEGNQEVTWRRDLERGRGDVGSLREDYCDGYYIRV